MVNFFDCISTNFVDNYLYIDGISNRLGSRKYTLIPDSTNVTPDRSQTHTLITALQIASYLTIILPLIALAFKAITRSIYSYTIIDLSSSSSSSSGSSSSSSTSSTSTIKAKEAPMIDLTRLGNQWLKDERTTVLGGGAWSDRAAYYKVLGRITDEQKKDKECNNAKLFPERSVTAAEVQQLSPDQLLKLSSADYMAIVDLLSGDQGFAILRNSKTSLERHHALYLCPNFAKEFGITLRRLAVLPVDKSIQEVAQKTFNTLRKYNADAMRKFQSTETYRNLNSERMQTSATLAITDLASYTTELKYAQSNWDKINEDLLVTGLQEPVTAEFLLKLNQSLRDSTSSRCVEYRTERVECPIFSGKVFYTPGRQVPHEIEPFVQWLNAQIKECVAGAKNPIVVAGLAFRYFITIHPFDDGNGRTGRLLVDLILRRFDLLPIAWGSKDEVGDCNMFLHLPDNHPQNSPNAVVQRLVKALGRSHSLAG